MKKKTTTKKAAGKRASGPVLPKAKLAAIRKELLAMREDLSRTVRKQEINQGVDNGDSVDQASQSIERELLFELSDNERVTLDQVEAALRKIDKGTYGVCESCRKPIAKARLNALPFARYCIQCQGAAESAPDLAEAGPDFRAIGEEPGAGAREY